MADPKVPAGPPPSYQQATGSSSTPSSSRPAASASASASGKGSTLTIPTAVRRSMEDESRPLPSGWVRTYDPDSHHQFFVDTTKDPPRSIWIHPYDDEEYLSTLTSEERERVEEESQHRGKTPSHHDIMHAHSDDDTEDHTSHPSHTKATSSYPHELPPRPDGKGNDGRSFGRKWKDKITGTTHEEREKQRAVRAEQERKMYEYHMKVRQAMSVAAQTGQPQLIGKDKDGKDIYVEPPNYRGYGGYGGGYGYNPYGSGGVYSTPNARYIRPADPYYRPYGGGYGGGYGFPLGLGGGLAGGLLLGDLFLGGF